MKVQHHNLNSAVTRRSFLRRSVAGTTGLLILPSARLAFGAQANERVNLAVIGDMYVADHFFTSVHAYENVNIVALCHPDERKFPKAFKVWEERAQHWPNSTKEHERKAAQQYQRLTKTKTYADFRRMLDVMGNDIDAVVVSMFDHLHGVMAGAAMRAGKHVFSERPLGLKIHEARALRDLAAKQKVATSIRNPGNASGPFRRAIELIREGAIGTVEEVHVWFDRGGPDHQQTPQGTPPVPEGLHWDLWLGPAALRPYHPDWMAYAHWRDFSNGGIGTFGPHAANLPFMALNIHQLWQAKQPIRVQAECSRINRISFPRWEIIRWKIPARGELPPVNFTWHHGPKHAPGAVELLVGKMRDRGASQEEAEKLLGYAGTLLVGSKGALVSDDHNVKFTLLPGERFRDIPQSNPKTLKPSRGHYPDWLAACRGGEQPWANFDYAAPLSEFLMLGNVATQFDGELEYDPLAGKILNHREANAALSYEYRKGWSL